MAISATMNKWRGPKVAESTRNKNGALVWGGLHSEHRWNVINVYEKSNFFLEVEGGSSGVVGMCDRPGVHASGWTISFLGHRGDMWQLSDSNDACSFVFFIDLFNSLHNNPVKPQTQTNNSTLTNNSKILHTHIHRNCDSHPRRDHVFRHRFSQWRGTDIRRCDGWGYRYRQNECGRYVRVLDCIGLYCIGFRLDLDFGYFNFRR